MLFGEHRVPGLEQALPADSEHIAAVVRDGIYEVRLPRENGELLVAVNGMEGFDADAPDLEWPAGFGNDDSVLPDSEARDALHTCARQHKLAPAACQRL